MATYTHTNQGSTAPGLFDRLHVVFAGLRASLRRRAVYRQTIAELKSLSERDLGDLGISRYDINRVAREAAAAKVK